MAPPELHEVNIDPVGNLVIISKVADGADSYHFRVSSKALALASPTFASLFPSHAAHAGHYQIILHGDAPQTVGTLLELCHFKRTSPLPHAPLGGLYRLAILSQKYAITAPLVPWITIWAEPLHALDKLDFSKGNELKAWLTIACVYKQSHLFQKITKQAIITGSDISLDHSALRWESPYSDILERISPERTNALSKLIARSLGLLGHYRTTESICQEPTNAEQCDAVLLGSVLKGLMNLGVYQPIPVAPYSGMTVMGLVKRIQEFPFMWYPAHGASCGERIKNELKDIMKDVEEILNETKGFNLNSFETKKRTGQVESLILTAVDDFNNGIQTHEQQERNEAEEPRNEVNDEVKGETLHKNEHLADTTSFDTRSDCEGSATSVLALNEVPIGERESFERVEETMNNLQPQGSLDLGRLGQDSRICPGEEERPEWNQNVEGGIANLSFMEEREENNSEVQESDSEISDAKAIIVGGRGVDPGIAKSVTPDKQKEKLRPTAENFVPSFILGPPPPERNSRYISRNRKEPSTLLKPAPGQNLSARANAEARGQVWEVPGLELVRKYQRGPRFPFHPEVTVGDVSDTDHTIEIKRLKDSFPHLDNKLIVEFLRQSAWSSEDAMLMLRGGGMPMSSPNGDGISAEASCAALERTFLSTEERSIYPPQQLLEESVATTSKPPFIDSSTNTTIHREADDIPRISKPISHHETISISRLITGDDSSSVADNSPRFWPEVDRVLVLRGVKLQENSVAIKKLLAMFPRARADKGFIDVLYRSGWDIEKAARKFEDMGLIRNDAEGDRDAKSEPKLKRRGRGKAKAKAKAAERKE